MQSTSSGISYLQALKQVTNEALPFFLARFFENASDIIGATALLNINGLAPASALITPTLALLRGIPATYLAGVGILMGNAARENNDAKIGELFRTGIYFSFLFFLGVGLLGSFIAPILKVFSQPEFASDMTQLFMRYYAIGGFPTFVFVIMQQYSHASKYAKSNAVFTFLNRSLFVIFALGLLWGSAFLSFGNALPMGDVRSLGTGYAISAWLGAISFLIYLSTREKFKSHHIFKKDFSFKHCSEIHDASFPLGAYSASEFGIKLLLTFIIGTFGTNALVVTQPASLFSAFLANLLFAFGQGLSILISKRPRSEAYRTGSVGIVIGFAMISILLITAPSFSNAFVRFFMPESARTADNISSAVKWFYFGLATQIPTAVRNLGTASLRGLKGSLGQLVNSLPIYINIAAHLFITIPLAFGLSSISQIEVAGTFIAPLVAISFTAISVFIFWNKVQNETATLTPASLRKMFSLRRRSPEGYSELEEAPLQNTA